MWLSVKSGIWKLAANTEQGGCQFHVWSGNEFGWVVFTNEKGPPKHVERHLTKKLHKKLKKLESNGTVSRTPMS